MKKEGDYSYHHPEWSRQFLGDMPVLDSNQYKMIRVLSHYYILYHPKEGRVLMEDYYELYDPEGGLDEKNSQV